jgi:hypothetical protein
MDLVSSEAQIGKEFGLRMLGFSRKVAREVMLADADEVRKEIALKLVERFAEQLIRMEGN